MMFSRGPEMLRTIEERQDRTVLMWIPAAGNNPVARYEVFRGLTPNSFEKIGQTTLGNFTDNTVQRGATYYYYVVAVDSMGMYSPASNMIISTTPF